MLHNEVNITALNKAVEKLQNDVEKLKISKDNLLMEINDRNCYSFATCIKWKYY